MGNSSCFSVGGAEFIGCLFLGLPIVFVIKFVIVVLHALVDGMPKKLVVGLLLELEPSDVVLHGEELSGQVLAEELGTLLEFERQDLVILGLLGACLVLPGESAQPQVPQAVEPALEVVATGGFDPVMQVEGGVADGAHEVPALGVGHVLAVLDILAGEPKIDDEDLAVVFGRKQEILGFDVPVQVALRVEVLDPLQSLLGHHQRGFQRQGTAAFGELIFKRPSEQIHHQVVEFALCAFRVYVGQPSVCD